MIGAPFNPANCAFIASQSLNANQFDPSVPDTGNTTIHNLLWDFVANKLYWVDAKTNLIKQELAAGGGQNETYSVVSVGPFDLTDVNQVYDNNYLLLPAGTYNIEAEYSYQPDAAGAETATIQVRTNVSQAVTTVNGSDVVQAERDTNVTYAAGVIVTQTVTCEPVTFAAPFIVKTALAVGVNAASAQNVLLRATLIK